MTDNDCNHGRLEQWFKNEIDDNKTFHNIVEIVRCPVCQQTFTPTVDDYGGDVYLRKATDPREMKQ